MKTIENLSFELVTNAYFNKWGKKVYCKRKCCFTWHLKKEAEKEIKELEHTLRLTKDRRIQQSLYGIIGYIKMKNNLK
jgi:hypothetical protein